MDELTRERYLLGVPYAERYRQPGPLRRRYPIADAATIEERRRVLDEALRPRVNRHRSASEDT